MVERTQKISGVKGVYVKGTRIDSIPAKSPAVITKLSKYNNVKLSSQTEENSSSNIFLKEYLEQKAKSNGVELPKGLQIKVSSPAAYSQEFRDLLTNVSKDIYGARVVDMMNLLEKPQNKVAERISKMKISEDEKAQITRLKELFDDYYKIEAHYNGQTINLLNMTKEDKEELSKISPDFAKFMERENKTLKKHAINFSRKEIQRLKLDDAGQNSTTMAKGVLPVLVGLIGLGIYRSKNTANEIKNDLPKFLEDQMKIYKKGSPKMKNPLKGFKGKKGFALVALLGTTIAGSWDDLMGCVKDFQQDKDNFGLRTALGINIPSAFLGIASSAAIAPMIEDQIEFNKAEKYLVKYGKITKSSAGIKGLMRKGGKAGLLAAGITIGTNILKGMLTTSSSSGSSWGSMAGTRFVLAQNGDKLEKKGIITKEENTFEGTNKNMLAYEAYDGKKDGIFISDPALGILGGGFGLFTHSNPYIQAASFGLQGCSETITACVYQIRGANKRQDSLDTEKQALVQSVK